MSFAGYDSWKLRAPEDEPGYLADEPEREPGPPETCGEPSDCVCGRCAESDERAEAEAGERESAR